MEEKKITLITMGQGNPIALKRTLEAFKGTYVEALFGDLLIFHEDRELIKTYQQEYNLKFVPLPFNYIYKYGFAATLNSIAAHAKTELVLYMNVGEVPDGAHLLNRTINELFPEYNCYAFDHEVDPHVWFRCYNPKELHWEGLIHEELRGMRNECPYFVFRMKDTEKDLGDPFKAKVYDDIKELTYFNQYLKLVERPEMIGVTNEGWVNFSKGSYQSLKERMEKKGNRRKAFEESNLQMYLDEVRNSEEFKFEKHESSDIIHFQQDKKPI
jgi:hypothetical protein